MADPNNLNMKEELDDEDEDEVVEEEQLSPEQLNENLIAACKDNDLANA